MRRQQEWLHGQISLEDLAEAIEVEAERLAWRQGKISKFLSASVTRWRDNGALEVRMLPEREGVIYETIESAREKIISVLREMGFSWKNNFSHAIMD